MIRGTPLEYLHKCYVFSLFTFQTLKYARLTVTQTKPTSENDNDNKERKVKVGKNSSSIPQSLVIFLYFPF